MRGAECQCTAEVGCVCLRAHRSVIGEVAGEWGFNFITRKFNSPLQLAHYTVGSLI